MSWGSSMISAAGHSSVRAHARARAGARGRTAQRPPAPLLAPPPPHPPAQPHATPPPLAELFWGLIGTDDYVINDGRVGPPIEGGSIDAMIMDSGMLSLSELPKAQTCGTKHHASCLYDYTFDDYSGLFGIDRNRSRLEDLLRPLYPNATRPTNWPHVELTAPFYSSTLGGIVKVSPHERGMWRVFAPFSASVWASVCVIFVGIALSLNLVFTMEFIRPPPRAQRSGEHAGDEPRAGDCSLPRPRGQHDYGEHGAAGDDFVMLRQPGATRRSPAKEAIDAGRAAFQAMTTSLYHTTTVCLGGDETEWAFSAMWSVRLLRAALLLCVLVLASTYTANLAAFFTADATTVYGPTSWDELNEAVGCFNGYYEPARRWLKDLHVPPVYPETPWVQNNDPTGHPVLARFNNTVIEAGRQYCLDALQSQQVDLYFGDIRLMHMDHLNDCEHTQELAFLEFNPFRVMFATVDSTLAVNLSKAFDLAYADMTIDTLQSEHFRKFEKCSSSDTNSELQPVGFYELSGMFLLVGVIAGLGVAIAVVGFFMRGRQASADADVPPMLATAPKPGAGGEAAAESLALLLARRRDEYRDLCDRLAEPAESLALLLARHRDEYCSIYDSLSHLRQPSKAPDAAPVARPADADGFATVRTDCSSTSATYPAMPAAGGYESPPTVGCVAIQYQGRRRRNKSKCAASADPYRSGEAAPVPAIITGRAVRSAGSLNSSDHDECVL